MTKRDYYEILGVARTATEDEIKKAIASWRFNAIRTVIRIIRKPRKNLRRHLRRTECCMMRKSVVSMTVMVTMGCKMPVSGI